MKTGGPACACTCYVCLFVSGVGHVQVGVLEYSARARGVCAGSYSDLGEDLPGRPAGGEEARVSELTSYQSR